MAVPGVNVTLRDTAPPRVAPTDTGVGFLVEFAEKGPVEATLTTSLKKVVNTFGARETDSYLYDAAEVFFEEGGSKLYIGRRTGPNPVKGSATLTSGGGTAGTAVMAVLADSYGDWSNGYKLAVDDEAGASVSFRVLDTDGDEVDASGVLDNQQDAIDWGDASDYVDTINLSGTALPGAGTVTIAGGTDDRANSGTADFSTALSHFNRDLGPGQVFSPGNVSEDEQTLLLDHAAENNRRAILDTPDDDSPGTLSAAAQAFATYENGRYGAMFGPWVNIRGVLPRTVRKVPYSAIQAGLIAREDSLTTPNVPAAGQEGQPVSVLSINGTFTDAERESLNEDGVNLVIVKYGGIRTYGYRSLAPKDTDPNWWQFSNSRLVMGVQAIAEGVGDRHLFAQIDGQGVEIGKFQGELIGQACLPYYNAGSLFGATPEQAFRVDVGQPDGAGGYPDVNPAEDLADGILRAVISLRISPFAEDIEIEIVRRAITQPV